MLFSGHAKGRCAKETVRVKHTDYGNNRKTKPYYMCCNELCCVYIYNMLCSFVCTFCYVHVQVYMGELRNKCVKNVPDGWNVTYEEWRM